MAEPTAATTSPPADERTQTYNQLTSCPDMEPAFVALYERCGSYSMTSLERLYGLYKAVEYVVHHDMPGDIVECGVWRGGSCMLAAMALKQFGDTQRAIYLYDTFAGMTDPTEHDVDYNDAHVSLRLNDAWPEYQAIANVPLEQVRQNMSTTGYPEHKVHYVKGPVEQTIPGTQPDQIALLRLDTDWYESTRHEMEHLMPRLLAGGVLIVDDYGHWQGARRAVDEYLETHGIAMLLNRVDYTGRIGIRP